MPLSFKCHRFPPTIIRHSIWRHARFTLNLRDAEEMLAERDLDMPYETIRRWFFRFRPVTAGRRSPYLARTMKRYGRPKSSVTDRSRAYRAAMTAIGNAERRQCGRWPNNRTENSHQPIQRREGAMARFMDVKTLQNFAAVHAFDCKNFIVGRHLTRRNTFKQNRSAAPADWRQLAA